MTRTRKLTCISSMLIAASASAGAAERITIDGRSAESFEHSHAELVASLPHEDRLQLSLAEVVLLESKGCLGKHPARAGSFMDQQLGGPVNVTPCRKYLHGLGFREIMERAYPARGNRGSRALPPNNSSKPTPLRGAA